MRIWSTGRGGKFSPVAEGGMFEDVSHSVVCSSERLETA